MTPIHHGILPVGSGQEAEDALEVADPEEELLPELDVLLPELSLDLVVLLELLLEPLLLLDSLLELEVEPETVEEEPLRESVR